MTMDIKKAVLRFAVQLGGDKSGQMGVAQPSAMAHDWRWLIASHRKSMAALVLAIAIPLAIWHVPKELTEHGRIALIVLALAVIGWTLTRIGDTVVSLAAALALSATGVLSSKSLFGSLGHELIWLVVAAFVMSAIVRRSGLIERLMSLATRRLRTVRELFWMLTGVISLTAFIIPSTSGRATLLLPVFLALAERMASERIVKALALLFPTVILLSAAGSLIGAGAHIVAVDFVFRSSGERLDFFSWMALVGPFAIISSCAATWLITHLFLTEVEASQRLALDARKPEPISPRQAAIAAIVVFTILGWVSVPLHGLSIALIALGGVLALLAPGVSVLKTKDAFKAVEVELLVFLATTFVIADALAQTGADKWIAQGLLDAMAGSLATSAVMVMGVVALVSLSLHLVVTSRTARATVLIPSFTLPLAGLGHDPKLLILMTVVGTGFCQTFTASAKPVSIFASHDKPTYEPQDLTRLSAALFPVMFVLLMLFGFLVWADDRTSSRDVSGCASGSCGAPPVPMAAATPVAAAPVDRGPPGCTDAVLADAMRHLIRQEELYASGWWWVWNGMRKAGLEADKKDVARIYRAEDMVLIRARRLPASEAERLEKAWGTCDGKPDRARRKQ